MSEKVSFEDALLANLLGGAPALSEVQPEYFLNQPNQITLSTNYSILRLLYREPNSSAPLRQPVLLVHNAWHSAGSFVYNLLPYLAFCGHPAYALDLRGHGLSPIPKSQGELDAVKARHYCLDVKCGIDYIMRQHNTAPFLIGHGMGAYIIQNVLSMRMSSALYEVDATVVQSRTDSSERDTLLATNIPQPYPGIVMIAPWGPLSGDRIVKRLHSDVWRPRIMTGGENSYHLLEDLQIVSDLFFRPDTPVELLVDCAQVQLGPESLRALKKMQKNIDVGFVVHPPVPSEQNEAVGDQPPAQPALVIGAIGDGLVRPEFVEETAREWHTNPVWMPGGHDIILDTAWEQLAVAVCRWLECPTPEVAQTLARVSQEAREPKNQEAE